MVQVEEPQTVFALSSGAGRSAVAVIRVSGPQTGFATATLAGSVPPPRRAVVRTLAGRSGQPIDEALVLFFKAPQSFTGEDVAEFHVHGGSAVVKAVLHELGSLPGLRPARPGEFSRRALLNGKLDLTKAEAIADLIDSETDQQRIQALRQYGGALASVVSRWRADLIDGLALIEAELDFSDEHDVSDQGLRLAQGLIAGVQAEVDRELSRTRAERVREGLIVVIAGPPNAGKSTLLNWLAGREAAIVTDIPGTTRDPVEVHLDLKGIPVRMIDTAGLRETSDPVEKVGVARSLERAASADLVVWLDPEPDSVRPAFDAPVLSVQTKIDSGAQRSFEAGRILLSVLTGEGLDAFEAALTRFLQEGEGREDGGLITRARHRHALSAAAEHLARASSGAGSGAPPEFVAEDLRLAVRHLDILIGRVDVEDVLDRLFASFCIGK